MQWRINVSEVPSQETVWPARVSVPLPQGVGSQESRFAVQAGDGSKQPAQAQVLTRWPDGSPRWVQLDFQARGNGAHVVSLETGAGAIVGPVQAQPANGTWKIVSGELELTCAGGELGIRYRGKTIAEPGSLRFTATDEQGACYRLTSDPDSVVVERQGPCRFQMSWRAVHRSPAGRELLHARLRLEVLAGTDGFTLGYQFFHLLPGCEKLVLQSIDAEFITAPAEDQKVAVLQTQHSNLTIYHVARVDHQVPVVLDRSHFHPRVEDAARALDDDSDYPHFLRRCGRSVGTAVALENRDAALCFTLRDMANHRPKTLDLAPGRITLGIWPRSAGPLVLPQGRSWRQELCFRFAAPDPAVTNARLTTVAKVELKPALGWLDKQDSAHAGPSWDQPRLFDAKTPGGAFFDHVFTTATANFHTVAEMFHYGDCPDIGYTMTYPGVVNYPQTNPPTEFTFDETSAVSRLFHNPNELQPVWTNNEYDAIYCLALESLRTRNHAAWKKMVAAARHQLEVDFVHYCDHWQQHRGTPAHSYDHNSGTAIIASHQWTQGLYYYYALTGDDDVLEVVRDICEYNIRFIENDDLAFSIYFNRELGWALVAMVFGYEMLGEPRYIQYAQKIIRVLQLHAQRTDFADLATKTRSTLGLNSTGIGIGFNVNTIPLGLKCYHQATGEPWALELLEQWVDFGMGNFNDRRHGVRISELFPETFTYIVEVTGKTEYLTQSRWHLRGFFAGFNSLGWNQTTPYGAPYPLDTKRYTRIYRGLMFLLSACARAGMLEDVERDLLGA